MKVVHYFLGADLRCGHEGLIKLAKSKEIELEAMAPGEAVIFINHENNKLKSYSANGVISYIRFTDKKRAIDMVAMDEIARAFNPNGTLDYGKALKRSLIKRLASGKFEEIEYK